ncbi:FUSC family protein [Anaerosacchariphilus polymeriproducens]|uniref:ABC transporter permease n=1 Tax=Anaerosacchariphilus polymeriproducens TaxID=1812858 RepID=A0A371AY77_9FIRM|nr:hypothetical protein [Anaerosacchariphilus polymeriproducens]RDU24479.1 hypothetical protein DWV06_03115 [Anaerosacchariphilus polymeriproducens]
MKLKKSFYHSAIIKNNFSRYYPILIAYTLLWCISLPTILYNRLSNIKIAQGNAIDLSDTFKGIVLKGTFSILIVLAAIIIAMITFSYLFQSRSCNMYHALPVNREQLFFSNLFSGLCFLLIPLVLTFFLIMIIGSLFHCLDLTVLTHWLGATVLMSIFFYSFAVFCAMFTGNILALPIFYMILNFLTVSVESIVGLLFSGLLYGYSNIGSTKTDMFSPGYYILNRLLIENPSPGVYKTHWNFLWIYAIAAVVLILISLFIYKKRNLETAGDYVCIKWVKPIFLYGFTFCFSICFSLFILKVLNSGSEHESIIPLVICMFIGGFFGYFIAKMILLKSFRVIKEGFRGWICYSVIIVAFMFFINSDIFGIASWIPKAEDISSVSYDINYEHGNIFNKSENPRDIIDIHKSIIENKDKIIKDSKKAFIESEITYNSNISFTYELKNGKKVSRHYSFMVDPNMNYEENSVYSKIDKFINRPEQIIATNFPPIQSPKQLDAINLDYLNTKQQVKTHSITGKDALIVYNAIIKDIQDGIIKNNYDSTNKESSLSSCSIWVEFDESVSENYYNNTFTIPYNAKHTLKALVDTGYLKSVDDLRPYTDYN